VNLPTSVVAALVLAVVWFFVVPLLVFAHELGHAAAILALTADAVTVGGGGERWRWRHGRLSVQFDPAGWQRWWYGFARYEGLAVTIPREVAVHFVGPALTLLVLLVMTALAATASGEWVRFGLYSAFWWTVSQLVATLAPIRYPSWWGPYADHPSDGLQAKRALGGE
jgi:hypothetical protein